MIKAIILIISLFILSSCGESDKLDKLRKQAIIDARNATPKIHEAYLACYGLSHNYKSKCVHKLAGKYISEEHRNNPYYELTFRYEAEKLGFLGFLHRYNLNCDYVDIVNHIILGA